MAKSFWSRVRTNLAETRARWTNRRFAGLAAPLGREWLVYAALSAVVIIAAGYLLDAASPPWVNGLPLPVKEFARATTDYAQSGWELFPAGAVILVLLAGDWDRVARAAKLAWAEAGAIAAFLFIAVGGAGIATNLLKSVVGRARPRLFDTTGAFGFHPFAFDAVYQSFPSGHATTCGAMAVVGAIILPRWRWPILVVAVLLSSTRVIVGAHYPSDVIAGLLLGAAFAYVLARYFAGSGYGLAFASDQRIVVRTGAIRRLLAKQGGWLSAWRGFAAALNPT